MSIDDRIRQTLEDRAGRAEVSDDAWAAISERTARRRPRFALALAALPVAVAVAVVVAVTGDDGPGVTTEAGPAGEGDGSGGPEGTVPAYDHRRPGAVENVATGEVVAVSLDGSALIVSDFDGRMDETGCEGMAEPILLRTPFDGTAREPVGVDPEGKPLSGKVVRGPDGRVAVVESCEEFLGRVLVGHENPDGTFSDVAEVDHALPGEAYITGWSASGRELLAIAWVQDGERRRAAVRFDAGTGEMQEIIRGEIHDVGELWNGEIVVAGDDGSVRAMDTRGTDRWAAPGDLFAISPDRRTVAVAGPEGIDTYPAEGDSRILAFTPDNGRITYMDWSASGETLTFVTEPADTTANPPRSTVYVVGFGNVKPVRVTEEPGRYDGPVFSAQGDLLALTRYRYDPDFSAEALVARFAARER